MSKKGKGGKKGPKKPKKGGVGEPSPEELSWILQTEKESLQKKYINEQLLANKAKSAENELKSKYLHFEKDYNEIVERTSDIISDMTRQFKSKEEDLVKYACLLKNKNNLMDTIEERKTTIDQLKKEKEKKLSEKDMLITQLRDNIDAMSNNFADMLKDTLAIMKSRIETASKQWEDENETNIMNRFDAHMSMK